MSTTCDFERIDGDLCGRRCYDGRCFAHKKAVSYKRCSQGCGRGTRSITGICCHCGSLAISRRACMKRAADAMDAYVADLIENWQVPPTIISNAGEDIRV